MYNCLSTFGPRELCDLTTTEASLHFKASVSVSVDVQHNTAAERNLYLAFCFVAMPDGQFQPGRCAIFDMEEVHKPKHSVTVLLKTLLGNGSTATTCSSWFLAGIFFYPEDGGYNFLRTVGSHRIYMIPYPRKRHS